MRTRRTSSSSRLSCKQPALDLAPVGLQLGFAGSPGPDPAAQLGHRRPSSGEPGQHVLQLRQLYLQLALAAARVAGKDVENQLGAIHHPHRQCVFKIPELGGGEVVIEEDQRGLGRFRDCGNLFHLAFADQRGRIRSGPSLQHFGDNLRPRAGDQLTKLCESRAAIRPARCSA